MRYFKEDEGGVGEMCELMEALAREERHEEKVKIAEWLIEQGFNVDKAAEGSKLAKEEVEQIALRLAQKHSA